MGLRMTLGKRIASGIGFTLVLMVAVGMAGYIGLSQVRGVTECYRDIKELETSISSIKGDMDRYLLANATGETGGQESMIKIMHTRLEGALKQAQGIKDRQAMDQQGKEKLASIEKDLKEYEKMMNAYFECEKGKQATALKVQGLYEPLIETMSKGDLWYDDELSQVKILRGVSTAYLKRNSEENWKSTETEMGKMQKVIEDWTKRVERIDKMQEVSKSLHAQFDSLKKRLAEHSALVLNQTSLRQRLNGCKAKLDGFCAQLGRASVEKLQRQTQSSVLFIFGFILAALVVGIGYAIFAIRRTVGPLNSAIQGISDGAEQVSKGADQVSVASRTLAEGASQEAASIEETSSSLEEMSSRTSQNANHAAEANSIIQETKQIVGTANETMSELTTSMEGIARSSDETSKIVKAIDEIAFQTNLLALNAAIEAARAGEAGAGFAVVADEVRNLAMRAAKAAQNTAGMIEDTVKKVKTGTDLVTRTNEAFEKVTLSATKVAGLVNEIATASREQALGIEEVNKAVAEMDKVVQQTASSAEESAGAATEMNAQAGKMKRFVQVLTSLVAGHAGKGI